MSVALKNLTRRLQFPLLYADPLEQHRAKSLNDYLIVAFVFLTALLVLNPLLKWLSGPIAWWAVLVTLSAFVAAWLLVRRGQLKAAVYLALGLSLVVITTTIAGLGKAYVGEMAGYLLVILIAALLLSRRELAVLVGLCIAAAAGLHLADISGFLSPAGPAPHATLWFGHTMVLLLMGLLAGWGVWAYERALTQVGAELTQRKQTEKELRATQEKLNMLLDTSPDFIYLIADDKTVLEANAAGAARLGRTRETMHGVNMFEVLPPALAAQRTQHLERVLATGETVTFQDERAGRWSESTMIPVRETDGRAVRVAIYARDVTAERAADAALRESQEKFNTLFKNMPLYGSLHKLVFDADGQIIDWEFDEANALGAASLGQTVEDLKGKRATDLFGAEAFAPYLELCRRVVASGEPHQFETYFEFNQRHYLASVFAVGQTHYATISVDITAQKHAESALRESEEKFAAAFQSAPMAMGVIDYSGRILEVNAAFARVGGYAPDELVGKTIADFVSPEEPKRLHLREEFLRAGGQVHEMELELRTRDGAPRTVSYSTNPVMLRGEPHFIATALDVTERKAAQEKLRESEEKFRAVIEQSRQGFALIDRDGTIIEWNSANEKFTGLDRTQAVGQKAWEMQNRLLLQSNENANLERARQLMLEALQTGVSPLFDRVREAEIFRNGERRHFRQSVYPIKGASGFRLGMTSEDITEQKRAELAVHASEALFHQMFEEHSAIMLLSDPITGTIVDVNRAATQFYGYSRETLLQMQISQINALPEAALTEHMTQVRQRRENEFIVPHRLASGAIREVQVFAVPLETPQGMRNYAIVHDITARREAEREILHLSTHDALTGVYNRAFFEAELERLGASRAFPISILIADLDNMKAINDTQGHLAGDALLKHAAQLLQGVCRASDILARIGGDEFAVLLPETDETAVTQLLKRIRETLPALNGQGDGPHVELSIGVATTHSNDLLRAFARADKDMYAEKLKHKRKVQD